MKRILLFFVTLILLSSSALGASTLLNGLYLEHDMDNPNMVGANVGDLVAANNGTNSGAATGVSGKHNQAVHFTGGGGNDLITNTNAEYADATTDSFTFSCWANHTDSTPSTQGQLYDGLTGAADTQRIWMTTGGDTSISTRDAGGAGKIITFSTKTANVWHNYIMRMDNVGNVFSAWVDGMNEGNLTVNDIKAIDNFRLGNDKNLANEFWGSIDECYIWNRSITDAEIQLIWLGGNGSFYPFPAPPVPPVEEVNITINTPADNSQFNTLSLDFNYTLVIKNGSNANCTLYRNSTIKNSSSNQGNGTYILTDNDLNSSTDLYFLYNVSCVNSLNESSNLRTVLVDNIFPKLEREYYDANNFITFLGNLFLSRDECGQTNCNSSYNHTLNVTGFDQNLYSINITSPVGDDWGINFYDNTISGTTLSVFPQINVSDLTAGNHKVNIKVCDGATADLNCNSSSYIWHKPSVTTENISQPLELFRYLYNLSIIYNTSYVTSSSPSLKVNSTSRFVSVFSNSTSGDQTSVKYYNQYPFLPQEQQTFVYPFEWNLILNSGNWSNFINETFTQSITRVNITDCSVQTTVYALNYSLLNINDASAVVTDLGGFYTLYGYSTSVNRQFNLSGTGASEYQVCIFPYYAAYNFNAQLETVAVGDFAKSEYNFQDTIINNVTQLVDINLIPNSTQVLMTVTDQDDNPVPDVFISILEYDLTTNSTTLSQIVKSDSNGEALGNMILNTQRYKFILTLNNQVILSPEPAILTINTLNFRVNLIEDYFVNYNTVLGISCALDYSNSTGNFTFQYIKPTGSPVAACLEVTRRSGLGDEQFSKTCTTANAAVLTSNVPSAGSFLYTASGYFLFEDEVFVCGEDSTTTDRNYLVYGLDGLFLTFLLTLTLTMVGVWAPTIAVAGLLIGIITSYVLGVFYLSWQFFIALIIIGGVVIYRLNKT